MVLTTTPDEETSTRIAQTVVGERLAACVQVLPGITSFYRWEGKIEKSGERLLLLKTTRERLKELTARIESLHPYEVPEVTAFEITGGTDKYIHWVQEETKRQV